MLAPGTRKPRGRSVREHCFRTRGLLNHSHLQEVVTTLESLLGHAVVVAWELPGASKQAALGCEKDVHGRGSLSVHRTLRRNAGVRKTGPQRAPSLTDEQNTLITGRVKANPRARRVGETDYALHLNPAKSSDTRDQRPSPIP